MPVGRGRGNPSTLFEVNEASEIVLMPVGRQRKPLLGQGPLARGRGPLRRWDMPGRSASLLLNRTTSSPYAVD